MRRQGQIGSEDWSLRNQGKAWHSQGSHKKCWISPMGLERLGITQRLCKTNLFLNRSQLGNSCIVRTIELLLIRFVCLYKWDLDIFSTNKSLFNSWFQIPKHNQPHNNHKKHLHKSCWRIFSLDLSDSYLQQSLTHHKRMGGWNFLKD